METMLNRFTQYALPFHLDTINQHRMNIEKVRGRVLQVVYVYCLG